MRSMQHHGMPTALARQRYHFTQTSTNWNPLNKQVSELLATA